MWVTRSELRGPVGSFDEVDAVGLPAGSEPSAIIDGTPDHRRVTFGIPEGPRGLPGVNAVAADEATAEYLRAVDAESHQAAREITVPVHKRVQGGVFPAPLRVPTLMVADAWPSSVSPLITRILWQDTNGLTMYAYGRDASLYKSTDGGRTWAWKAYLNWAPATFDAFLRTSTGTLLTIVAVSGGHEIRRSTDDGVTWTKVVDLQAGQRPLGPQSWCVDKVTGEIYYGEYGGETQTVMNLYRSSDDGLTWPVFYAFPGIMSGHVDRIRHVHAVQWDPVTQRVWVCTGDSTDATGLYRVNTARDSVIPMVTNRMLPPGSDTEGGFYDAPRSIGIMPFPDYIVWASDSTNNPCLFRAARSELGSPTPIVERIYRINSTAWWTVRAKGDGTRWVFSASQESRTAGKAIDNQVHLYAVEDQGATVYELAALPQTDDTLPAGSLQPIGLPEDQGEFFFLRTRTTGREAQWKLRLADASQAALSLPPNLPLVSAWITVNSGPTTVPASGNVAFHADAAPTFARTLRVFDANVKATDGSVGRIILRVVRTDTSEVIYSTTAASVRQTTHREWGPYMFELQLPANTPVEFRVGNTHGALAVDGLAAITYGWGS